MIAFPIARLGLSASYLIAAQHVSSRTGFAAVLRILAVRHSVQAGTTLARPSLVSFGVGVDALHAVSMAAVAAGSRRYRRAALADTAIATTLTGAGLLLGHRAGAHAERSVA